MLAALTLAGLVAAVVGAGAATLKPKTIRISLKPNGSEVPASQSEYAAISADGRYTVFETDGKFVGKDDPLDFDVYLYDRRTKRLRLVSVKSNGKDGNNLEAGAADISPNGRYVCFGANGAFVGADQNGIHDVYRHDRETGKTILISLTTDEQQLAGVDDDSELCGVADNGLVAWESMGAFVQGDTNGDTDIFVRDPKAGTTRRATLDHQDDELPSGGDIGKDSRVAISGNGKFVAFQSFDVATTDPDSAFGGGMDSDVFVRNLAKGTTTRVSLKSNGDEAVPPGDNAVSRTPSISRDGRYVAFQSDAQFVAADTNNLQWDIYVRDRERNRTILASVKSNEDVLATTGNQWFEISPSGRYVAWDTFGNYGGGPDPMNWRDVYRRDLETGRTKLISLKSNGGRGDGNQLPDVSGNGRWIPFQTMDKMTGQPDDGMDWDVFLRGPVR